VGQSDFKCSLAVKAGSGDQQYALGILIDDGKHYQNKNLIEQYYQRPAILQNFGWRILPVFAKDWLHQPQKVMEQIRKLLEEPLLPAEQGLGKAETGKDPAGGIGRKGSEKGRAGAGAREEGEGADGTGARGTTMDGTDADGGSAAGGSAAGRTRMDAGVEETGAGEAVDGRGTGETGSGAGGRGTGERAAGGAKGPGASAGGAGTGRMGEGETGARTSTAGAKGGPVEMKGVSAGDDPSGGGLHTGKRGIYDELSFRRLHYREGEVEKFWEAAVDGSRLILRWGRVGTKGQLQLKSFPDEEAAGREIEKLIREKMGKGYQA
jgi:predicted DNA-binding WGR domain protein